MDRFCRLIESAVCNLRPRNQNRGINAVGFHEQRRLPLEAPGR